jgi:hypothetical protein
MIQDMIDGMLHIGSSAIVPPQPPMPPNVTRRARSLPQCQLAYINTIACHQLSVFRQQKITSRERKKYYAKSITRKVPNLQEAAQAHQIAMQAQAAAASVKGGNDMLSNAPWWGAVQAEFSA